MTFEKQMDEFLSQQNGYEKIGISIREIGGSFSYERNQDDFMPTASTMKVFVLGALIKKCERGEEDLNRLVTIHEDKFYPGSGVLKYLSDGISITVKDLMMLMIILSDNSATNLCIDLLGGTEAVNDHIRETGVKNAGVYRKVYDTSPNPEKKKLAEVTPRAFTDYLICMRTTDYLNPDSKKLFFRMLEKQQFKNMFARYMPLEDFTDDGCVKVMSKTGYSGGTRCDTGIIIGPDKREYAYAIQVSGSKDESYSYDNKTYLMMAEMGRIFYDTVLEGKK